MLINFYIEQVRPLSKEMVQVGTQRKTKVSINFCGVLDFKAILLTILLYVRNVPEYLKNDRIHLLLHF